MLRPIVGLLTDFGLRDSYVAQMKLVIASRSDCEIMDLSHEIPRQDVVAAGLFVREVRSTLYRAGHDREFYFITVIDPGVGTERRILVARKGKETILAPDNGILPIAFVEPPDFVRSIDRADLFLPSESRTFHGRDRFAPVAAALVNGVHPAKVGAELAWEALARVGWKDPVYETRQARGSVVSTDHFGNIVTDLDASRLDSMSPYELLIGDRMISMIHASYADAGRSEEPFLIVGSRNTLEISVNRGSAAELLQPERFEEVVIRPMKRES